MHYSVLQIRLDEPIKAETLELLIDPAITDPAACDLLALELEELWVQIPYGSFIQLNRRSIDSAKSCWNVDFHLRISDSQTIVLPLSPQAICWTRISDYIGIIREAFSLGRTFEREDL
ncbi:MAG: hypothetical protein K2R93_10980 [Gemmatimonadaceae bacterium]|nr:hypothetical protein [Gemmatimonadaceae bacterium]